MKKFLLLFALASATIGGASAMTKPQTPPKATTLATARELQNADKLFGLLNARLGLMRAVALSKWRSGGAIEDLPRERIVIEKARDRARLEGLRNVDVLTRAQIEMAKSVQRHWHRRWASEGLDGREIAPPLTTIRARIGTLDAQILVALNDALPPLNDAQLQSRLRLIFLRRLRVGTFTDAQRFSLFEALQKVRRAPTSSTR